MQDILGEVFAWLFVAFMFFVVFVLPIWFVIRHNKKSKMRLKEAIKKQESETPEQTQQRLRNHQITILGAVFIFFGFLFASRWWGAPVIGFIPALILMMLVKSLVVRLRAKKAGPVTFDTTLTRIGNGKVKTGPIPAAKFIDALDSGRGFRITTDESYKRISEINTRKNKGKE